MQHVALNSMLESICRGATEGIDLTSTAATESSAPCLPSDLVTRSGPAGCVDTDSSSIRLPRLARQRREKRREREEKLKLCKSSWIRSHQITIKQFWHESPVKRYPGEAHRSSTVMMLTCTQTLLASSCGRVCQTAPTVALRARGDNKRGGVVRVRWVR